MFSSNIPPLRLVRCVRREMALLENAHLVSRDELVRRINIIAKRSNRAVCVMSSASIENLIDDREKPTRARHTALLGVLAQIREIRASM